jgi:lipopolysaccharide transport system ATP-binding protein
LFVSHNLAAVENLCERCVWIDHGQVHMDGETHTVIRDYMASQRKSDVAGVDLEETQSRRGNGKIRFQGIEFLSPEGISQKIVRSGDPVVMRFHYLAHERVAYPSFGFKMYTESGILVTATSTSHHGIYIPSVEPGRGYLDLEIPCLNLLAAKFPISLWVTDQAGTVVYDNVENAINLEVDAANPYGSNFVIDSRFGTVYFPQKWDLAGLSGASQDAPNATENAVEQTKETLSRP